MVGRNHSILGCQEWVHVVYWPMAATHKPHEPTPDSPEWNDFDPPSNHSLGGRTWAELEDGSWEDDPKFYKDMVEYHDKVIGKLIDYLAQQNLSEDTLKPLCV
jgi:arylsulfatase A-like enzyme